MSIRPAEHVVFEIEEEGLKFFIGASLGGGKGEAKNKIKEWDEEQNLSGHLFTSWSSQPMISHAFGELEVIYSNEKEKSTIRNIPLTRV